MPENADPEKEKGWYTKPVFTSAKPVKRSAKWIAGLGLAYFIIKGTIVTVVILWGIYRSTH